MQLGIYGVAAGRTASGLPHWRATMDWRNLELMIRVRCGLETGPCAGHKAAAPHGTGHARAAAVQANLVQLALHAPAAVAHLAFEMSGSNLGIEAGSSGVTVAVASLPPAAIPRPAPAQNPARPHNTKVALLRRDEAVAFHYRCSRAKRAVAFFVSHAPP